VEIAWRAWIFKPTTVDLLRRNHSDWLYEKKGLLEPMVPGQKKKVLPASLDVWQLLRGLLAFQGFVQLVLLQEESSWLATTVRIQ